jgi:ribonuclease VapC
MIVLDASALLVMLLKEPGHEKVAQRVPQSLISAVNFSEVLARLVREGLSPDEASPRLTELGLTVISFDQTQATIAASIREHARASGLGLADCCCLALALTEGLPVLTADRIWATLGLFVPIELVR